MNTDLLTIGPAPVQPGIGGPWFAVCLRYGDDGPIVAVLWWDDRPFSDRDARLSEGTGVLAEAPIADDDLPEPGWEWWVVGNEGPWFHDPRFDVAEVEVVGPGTPAQAVTALASTLAEAPEPDFSYEQSVGMLAGRLQWCPAPEGMAEVFEQEIGSGTVIVDKSEDR